MNTSLEQETDLSPETMKGIVRELAAVKSRQDIDAALALYHRDAVLLSPPLGTRFEGSEAIREGLIAFFRFAPDYQVDVEAMAADDGTLCAWGEIHFTPSYTFQGELPERRRIHTPVFILFRFRERQVVWESFHFDLAEIAHQVGVPAEAFQRRGKAA